MNRYTDITTAEYNPMSLQELMMAPAYKRNQHDNLLEASSALETNIAQVDPLEYHSQAAQEEQMRLQEQISSQTELLNKEGFNPNSKQGFINLNKEYQKSISPTGTLGKINNAKAVLAANKKAHVDQAIKEGFTAEQALMNWQKHEQDYAKEYAATGNISPIGELGTPKYVDYLDTATKLFTAAGFTERDLAGGVISKLITTDPRGQYVLNEGGGKITKNNREQLGAAVKWLNNNLQNPNSEIRQSIDYQGKSPNQVLSEIGNLAEVYLDDSVKSDYTRTMTGFKSAKELGLGPNSGYGDNVPHVTLPAENKIRFKNSMLSNLKDIIENKIIDISSPDSKSVNNRNAAAFNSVGTTSTLYSTKKAKSSVENHLNESEKERYDKIVDILSKQDNVKVLTSSKYSPEEAEEVYNYMNNNSELLYQDQVIQTDIVKTYGGSQGSNSKTKKEVLDNIVTNLSVSQFDIDGRDYTYDELPSEVRSQLANNENVNYLGFMSPNNFRGMEKESNKSLYVSPHVLELKDDEGNVLNTVLIGRQANERSTKEFKTDAVYKDIRAHAIDIPGEEIPIPQTNSRVVYKDGMYIIKNNSGQTPPMNEATLQAFLHEKIDYSNYKN